MKLPFVLLMAMLAVRALGASAILDATWQTTPVLHTGDSLNFEIFGGSFGLNARAFGLQNYATDVSFAFVSAPTEWAGSFSGTLGFADGTSSVEFSGLTFSRGVFSGAGYQGPAAALQGYLRLPPRLSQQLSGGGAAWLTLRNEGPDFVAGLDPYFLRQDLYISLHGGPLSVGATGGSVMLQSASAGLSAAPEPGCLELFSAGGALLAVSFRRLRRVSKRPKQGEKSTVCNPPIQSDTIYMESFP